MAAGLWTRVAAVVIAAVATAGLVMAAVAAAGPAAKAIMRLVASTEALGVRRRILLSGTG